MYLFLLRMYLGFQFLFWDGERFPITYQESSKEYINYAIRDRDHILIGMDALIFLKDVPIFLFYEITIKG